MLCAKYITIIAARSSLLFSSLLFFIRIRNVRTHTHTSSGSIILLYTTFFQRIFAVIHHVL
jgi:hypothetical protein